VLPSGAQLSAVRLAGDVNAQVDSASLERQDMSNTTEMTASPRLRAMF
jgi:hypothetical protein